MSIIGEFSVNKKSKKVTIDGVDLVIKPLPSDYIPLLMEMSDMETTKEQGQAINEIIAITLKEAVPDVTEEELKQMSLGCVVPLMEAIMEINSLEDLKEKKALWQRMEHVKNLRETGNKTE